MFPVIPSNIISSIKNVVSLVALILLVLLSVYSWVMTKDNISLKVEISNLENKVVVTDTLLSTCSKATEEAAKADIKKMEEVREAQKRAVILANKQIAIAQDILAATPKSSDLCKESFDLLEGYLVELKKEGVPK